jgi:hypothetical protein
VFTKKNNKLAFKQDADLNAGGLIVQGKQITGTFQKCTVKSLHDNGSDVKVIASCSDGVSVSDVSSSRLQRHQVENTTTTPVTEQNGTAYPNHANWTNGAGSGTTTGAITVITAPGANSL